MQPIITEEEKIRMTNERPRVRHHRIVASLRSVTKHTLLIAACAGGLLAGYPVAAVAEQPAPALSAPALFNEGNADQRAGNLGSAILNYERARLLDPRDGAIAKNLSTAREQAGVAGPAVPVWQKPAHWLKLNELAAVGSFSIALFGLLILGAKHVPTPRAVGAGLGVVLVLASTAIALRWPEIDRAVIVGDQPVAHIAPAANSAEAFQVKPGEIVSEEGRHGDYIRIRIADGRSGWVAGTEVERIIPDKA